MLLPAALEAGECNTGKESSHQCYELRRATTVSAADIVVGRLRCVEVFPHHLPMTLLQNLATMQKGILKEREQALEFELRSKLGFMVFVKKTIVHTSSSAALSSATATRFTDDVSF